MYEVFQIGMIQVVKRSRTFGEIGILFPSNLIKWLKEHNPEKAAFVD